MESDNISLKVKRLIESQLKDWELAKQNYEGLSTVIVREIPFDGFRIFVQCNPERMRSSVAKVDTQSIRERKCFLCWENLPPKQVSVDVLEKYTVLVNPFPIFNQHLTIPDKIHVDQFIKGRIDDCLALAKVLPDFTLFYNGPKCGASAPDHFHFQAGNKGLLPIEGDIHSMDKQIIQRTGESLIFTLENYLRKVLVLQSPDKQWISNQFADILSRLKKLQPNEPEPMINLLAWYEKGKWLLAIFPRRKHRPDQFFEKGEEQILISPASVDFGGVFITPRIEDFEKINPEIIRDIFDQVSISDEDWQKLLIEISI